MRIWLHRVRLTIKLKPDWTDRQIAESEGLLTQWLLILVRQLRQRIMWRFPPHYLAKVGKVGAEIEVRNATNPSKKDVVVARATTTSPPPKPVTQGKAAKKLGHAPGRTLGFGTFCTGAEG